ncbi:protein kinase [Streptomyces sp. NPDC005574]|uniref:serine/threonine-protein kinase n=1 Tax=Streptomyces sp. NPDC005574 TaxID=3156891 RepID=UPI0033BC145E
MEKLGAGDPPRIGGYRLLARLGAGGMGQVYLARSDRGRTVAVKLVRRELAAQEEFRARFRQEVEAARQVGGHWTAPVLDADTEAAVPWVATGYVAGPSLQQVVGRDHGALPERSVRILAAGLAHALGDIHAAGIVHRDLKPSNVLLTIDGPRVIDFGIARALETVTEAGLTRTGALVGSPGFMAPEQVRGDRITPACDVFCLGSVLAYAATGRLPFGATHSGVHALMFRIAQEEPDLTGVPEGIADLVRACLRKDPAARPTPARVLERTGAGDTVSGGRSRDPWLPGALVAQLGRHAVRLLDTENPEGAEGGPGPEGSARAAGSVGSAWSVGPARSPRPTRPALAPAPEASPEHAPAADGSAGDDAPTEPDPVTPPGPTPSAPTPPAPGHRPAPHAGRPSSAGPAAGTGGAPPHPAYGSAQQHPGPHPSAYGYPQAGQAYGGGLGSTPPYGPPLTAAQGPVSGPPSFGPPPGPTPEPPRRSGRSTVALVAVALVVALGAGGSVYALMKGGGDGGVSALGPSPSTGASVTSPGPRPSEPSPTASEATGTATAEGAIPDSFLGTWTASIDNATGHNTRQLTIRQGEVGDSVLSLVADGPVGGGTYHCEFRATLSERPSAEGSLTIGPSSVTAGEPRSSCSPGAASEITLLSDGRLERVNTDSGDKLTYLRR